MLEPAFYWKDELKKAQRSIVGKDKYKFYNHQAYWDYKMTLEDNTNTWNRMDFVSLNDKTILGYLRANLGRVENRVSNLAVVRFTDAPSLTFSKDLYTFLEDLFVKYNFNKIEFAVVIGNPAEKMYDRIASKYGGRVVGIFKEIVRLVDNQLYDEKYYEIMRRDFMARSK